MKEQTPIERPQAKKYNADYFTDTEKERKREKKERKKKKEREKERKKEKLAKTAANHSRVAENRNTSAIDLHALFLFGQ